MARLIFLGSGGDATVVGKQLRGSGGIILQIEEDLLHIDPGPGSLLRAKQFGVNLRNAIAILASHNHINHVNDINAVVSAMTQGGLDTKGVIIGSKSVFEGDAANKPYLQDRFKSFVEKTITLAKGERVGVNNIDIEALPTKHSDESGIGFKIKAENFTIAYSGDTAYDPGIVETYKGSDILVLNVIYPAGSENCDALSSDDVVKIVNEVKPNLTLITHFGIKIINADALYEAREIQKKVNSQIISISDGLLINPNDYGVSNKKKFY
jgi:ribonuclease BN (tRNA processing enzyme)